MNSAKEIKYQATGALRFFSVKAHHKPLNSTKTATRAHLRRYELAKPGTDTTQYGTDVTHNGTDATHYVTDAAQHDTPKTLITSFFLTLPDTKSQVMRYIVTLIIILCANGVNAQINDDGLVRAKLLGLDTTLSGAAAFNETLIRNCIPGYAIKFVENPHDGGTEIKYLYEHPNTSILKIDYTYRFSGKDSTGRPKPSIFSQRITADMNTITQIYNYLFGAAAKPDELDVYRGDSFDFVYDNRDYHYSFIPDDYRPGYWILTFTP